MILVKANTRRAAALSDDLITTSSSGIEVSFLCSAAWDGLSRTAIFRGSDVSVDVALAGPSCTVPPEVLTKPGGQLLIGLYGTDGTGSVAIPTVWADAGRIFPGAVPSGIEPTPETAPLIDQLLAAAQAARDAADAAEALAQSVRDDADAGHFDGRDGADGSNAWTIDASRVREVGSYIQCPLTYLVGPSAAAPRVGDVVFVSDGRMTQISRIVGPRADTTLIGNLHGAPGDPGTDGYAPEVTIEQIDGGHRVTITSADYPEGQSFDVMNGQGGSGGDLVEVTYTQSGSAVTCDKTYSEIVAALSAPHPVVVYGAVQGLGVVAATCNTSMVDGTGAITSVLVTGPCDYMVIKHPASGAITINTYEYSPISAVSEGSTQPPTSGAVYDALANKYEKPSGGIPETDLASEVQASLGKADTALQSFTETDPTVPNWAKASSKPSYSASEVGAVAVAQGVAHAGEFCVVGSDGNITTVSVPSARGVSF